MTGWGSTTNTCRYCGAARSVDATIRAPGGLLARQRSLQRLVALKVSANRGVEPQTLAQLDHPHIVRVYDQRTVPGGGMRLLYMPIWELPYLRKVDLINKKMLGNQQSNLLKASNI